MLARNKCEVHSIDYGFDNCYIEDNEVSVGTLMNYSIGKGADFTACMDGQLLIYPRGNFDTLRVYAYNNQRLSIENAKIIYIDVNSEDDIKKDLLYRGEQLYTYIVEDDTKIRRKTQGYKNYKVITGGDRRENGGCIVRYIRH